MFPPKRNIIIFIATSIVLVTCTIDNDTGYMSVNSEKFYLNHALIEYTFTTDTSKTFRAYNLKFQSHDSNYPSRYIMFRIFSNSADFLVAGTYNYTLLPEKAGDFSDCRVAYDLVYDRYNVPDGAFINSDSVTYGTVIITSERSNLKFEFDITFSDNNKKYYVTGKYEGFLFEGVTGLDNN